MRNDAPRLGWRFYAVVTVLSALPLVAAYWWLSGKLLDSEIARHQEQIANQLNLWQEQLYDLKWDSLADTSDDTLHLASADENRLLVQTLMWYVYPDGHCFLEGTGVIGADGVLRASRQAAVIDEAGEPLTAEALTRLKKLRPWLEDPWLPDYSFVMEAFRQDPEREFYLSPLIKAPGRMVMVMASVRRGEDGAPLDAVMHQLSVSEFYRNIIEPGARNLSVWLMDSRGAVGLARTGLAGASARLFRDQGRLAEVLASGADAAGEGRFGARGGIRQELAGGPARLYYRTLADDYILAVVESESELAQAGRDTLWAFGAIALCSLLVVILAGAVYTVAALKNQRASVEKATLLRFAGTLSHKVRNQLSTLRGAHEMILDRDLNDPAETARHLEELAVPAVNGIQDAVEDLERLSRGEIEVVYDGQAGDDTMYRLDGDAKVRGAK